MTEQGLIPPGEQQLLFGEPPTGASSTSPGHLRAAAESTIAAKREAGLLTDEHELTVQLILALASAVDSGLAWGKVTVATTTMAKELREAAASLPSDDVPDSPEWTQLVALLTPDTAPDGRLS